MRDIIIVGGGIAGLSTGAILSNEGMKVLLYEKNVLGGRAKCIEKDGYLVDYGIHLNRFAEDGIAAKLFSEIGEKLEFAELGEAKIFIDGKLERMPMSLGAFLTTCLLSIRGRLEIISLFIKIIRAKPEDHYDKSLAEWLGKRRGEIIRIVKILSGLTLICPDIEKVSAGEFISIIEKGLKSRKGAGYPKGGWKTIIERLKRKIEENGEIKYEKVDNVLIKRGEAIGVKVGEETIESNAVVCAVPVQELQPILPEVEVKKLEPTKGVSIDFGLRKKVTDIDGLILNPEPLMMGLITSNFDPSVAPAEKQLGTFFYPLKDISKADEAMEKMKKTISDIFPRIWDNLDWERKMVLDIVDGAIPIVSQSVNRRQNISSKIKGLFFAGDSTRGEGAGGDIAFDSAIKCANLVKKYLSEIQKITYPRPVQVFEG